AAAFFAADENVLLKHELANVFEADGNLVEFAIELCGELVDKFRDGEGFCDVTGKLAHAGKVPDEQRKNLVRIDEGSVAIDGADAIAVPISGKACVVFSGDNCVLQGADVRLDGFGMDSGKTRIACAANFVAVNAITAEKFGK